MLAGAVLAVALILAFSSVALAGTWDSAVNVSNNPAACDSEPLVSGDRIVWAYYNPTVASGGNAYTWELWTAADGESAQSFYEIPADSVIYDGDLVIDGDRVAWIENDETAGSLLYTMDLSKDTDPTLVESAESEQSIKDVALSGDRLAWVEYWYDTGAYEVLTWKVGDTDGSSLVTATGTDHDSVLVDGDLLAYCEYVLFDGYRGVSTLVLDLSPVDWTNWEYDIDADAVIVQALEYEPARRDLTMLSGGRLVWDVSTSEWDSDTTDIYTWTTEDDPLGAKAVTGNATKNIMPQICGSGDTIVWQGADASNGNAALFMWKAGDPVGGTQVTTSSASEEYLRIAAHGNNVVMLHATYGEETVEEVMAWRPGQPAPIAISGRVWIDNEEDNIYPQVSDVLAAWHSSHGEPRESNEYIYDQDVFKSDFSPEPTITLLASSVNPSDAGTEVTFTATITEGATAPPLGGPAAAAAAVGSISALGDATGTVQFYDGETALGDEQDVAAGVATYKTSELTAGSHLITAVYSGDEAWEESTSTSVDQVVNEGDTKSDTTTAVASSKNPSTYGDKVTFTATIGAGSPPVAPLGSPVGITALTDATGTVQFYDDDVELGEPQTIAAGVASITTDAFDLTAGTHVITAEYSGDSTYNSSTSEDLSQVVDGAPLTITAKNQTKAYGSTFTFAGTEFTASGILTDDEAAVSSVTLTSAGAAASAKAGTYAIVPSAASGTGLDNYDITYVNGTMTVSARGGAVAWYTGQTFIATKSSTDTSAQVTLKASVTDESKLEGGNISDAKVTFTDAITNKLLAKDIPVASVAGSTTDGVASTIVTLSSGQYGAQSYVVKVTVTGSFTGGNFGTGSQLDVNVASATITVQTPAIASSISGHGFIGYLSNTSLTDLGTEGSLTTSMGSGNSVEAGFYLTYKKGTTPKGQIYLIIPGPSDSFYVVKSNALTAATVATGLATINGKASITQVLGDGSVVSLDGGASLQLIASSAAGVAFTVQSSKTSALFFSNHWVKTGKAWGTVQQLFVPGTGSITIK